MKKSSKGRTRGSTLIEVMIALGVMLIGSAGALAGLIGADRSLREGQLRIYKQVLVDASIQRSRLHNKEKLYLGAVTVGAAAGMPSNLAIGTGIWAKDPTPVVAGDLSTGSLFIVLPDGTIGPCTTTTFPACPASITTCASTTIPDNVFCREVVTTRTGAVFAPGPIVPSTDTYVTTRWARVIQKKALVADTKAGAVIGNEVFAQ